MKDKLRNIALAVLAAFVLASTANAYHDVCTDKLAGKTYSCELELTSGEIIPICTYFDAAVNAVGILTASFDAGQPAPGELLCGCAAFMESNEVRCSAFDPSTGSEGVLSGKVKARGRRIKGDMLGVTTGNAGSLTCRVAPDC